MLTIKRRAARRNGAVIRLRKHFFAGRVLFRSTITEEKGKERKREREGDRFGRLKRRKTFVYCLAVKKLLIDNTRDTRVPCDKKQSELARSLSVYVHSHTYFRLQAQLTRSQQFTLTVRFLRWARTYNLKSVRRFDRLSATPIKPTTIRTVETRASKYSNIY